MTVVEPDADRMAELKTYIAQLLPDVTTTYCQETAQSWKVGDQPFDAVLMFHCLYHVPKLERPALFKKLYDKIVAKGRYVFILTCPGDLQNPCQFGKLKSSLLREDWIEVSCDGREVGERMTSVGFKLCHKMSFKCEVNMEEPFDDWKEAFMFWNGGRLSYEQVHKTVQEIVGSAKFLEQETWFGIFEKP